MYLAPVTTGFTYLLGTRMGWRTIIVLAVGLGALYTVHLLAQDWMKIQAGTKIGNLKKLYMFITSLKLLIFL